MDLHLKTIALGLTACSLSNNQDPPYSSSVLISIGTVALVDVTSALYMIHGDLPRRYAASSLASSRGLHFFLVSLHSCRLQFLRGAPCLEDVSSKPVLQMNGKRV